MIEFRTDFKNYALQELEESDENTGGNQNNYHEIQEVPALQTVMYFDKGIIPHPTIGKVKVHMKGFLLFCLPHGEYPKSATYDSAKMDALLRKLVLQYFSLDHQATTELKQLSTYPSTEIFLMAPSLKPWNKKTELFLKGAFLYWSMDEFLSRAVFSSVPLLTKEHFQDFIRFITNIMTGLYRNTDCIPNLDVPFMNSILRGWFEMYQDMKEQVLGYENFHGPLLNEIINWIRYYEMCALFMGCEWEPYNQPYVTLRNLSGRKVLLEILQLLTATYLDDFVRSHALFKVFCDSADLIFNMTHDLFTVTKGDLRSKKHCRNILYRNISRGMSFEKALEEQLLVINNEVIDMRKAAKGLHQIYPTNEMLHKYIRNTILFIDGSFKYFVQQTRYGLCEHKVMKIVRVPSPSHRRSV